MMISIIQLYKNVPLGLWKWLYLFEIYFISINKSFFQEFSFYEKKNIYRISFWPRDLEEKIENINS